MPSGGLRRPSSGGPGVEVAREAGGGRHPGPWLLGVSISPRPRRLGGRRERVGRRGGGGVGLSLHCQAWLCAGFAQPRLAVPPWPVGLGSHCQDWLCAGFALPRLAVPLWPVGLGLHCQAWLCAGFALPRLAVPPWPVGLGSHCQAWLCAGFAQPRLAVPPWPVGLGSHCQDWLCAGFAQPRLAVPLWPVGLGLHCQDWLCHRGWVLSHRGRKVAEATASGGSAAGRGALTSPEPPPRLATGANPCLPCCA